MMRPDESELRFKRCSATLLEHNLRVLNNYQQQNLIINLLLQKPMCKLLLLGGDRVLAEFHFDCNSIISCVNTTTLSINVKSDRLLLLHFSRIEDCLNLSNAISNYLQVRVGGSQVLSTFDNRTEESSAVQYFQFYGYLAQQQNMMQDYIRTSTYQRAILQNTIDFQDKVVIDVGAGSGILSFFAIQAGARKVYAVEASSISAHAETLVRSNQLSHKIEVLKGKIEEIDIPEMVDVIVSEPMGYMLFNERMLETFLHAKKWLKSNGLMFPTIANLHFAPFTDESLYIEQSCKANFWHQRAFYGIDLTSLQQTALLEVFRQPIVDTFDVRLLMARPSCYKTNFQSANETDLHDIYIPYHITIVTSGNMHGLAFWFDVEFAGSATSIWLSTAPHEPLTHWYQVRCLLRSPIFVRAGDIVSGHIKMTANNRQSYDIEILAEVPATGMKSIAEVDLKNPYFRYSIGQPYVPPGNNKTSPTESYWSQYYEETGNVNNSAYDSSNRSTQSNDRDWNRYLIEPMPDYDMNAISSYNEPVISVASDVKPSTKRDPRLGNSSSRQGPVSYDSSDGNRTSYLSTENQAGSRSKSPEMFSV